MEKGFAIAMLAVLIFTLPMSFSKVLSKVATYHFSPFFPAKKPFRGIETDNEI